MPFQLPFCLGRKLKLICNNICNEDTCRFVLVFIPKKILLLLLQQHPITAHPLLFYSHTTAFANTFKHRIFFLYVRLNVKECVTNSFNSQNKMSCYLEPGIMPNAKKHLKQNTPSFIHGDSSHKLLITVIYQNEDERNVFLKCGLFERFYYFRAPRRSITKRLH